MQHILKSVKNGGVEEVSRVLQDSNFYERVTMLKHVTRSEQLYFGDRSLLPTAEVTRVILINVDRVANVTEGKWIHALHIAVLYRMHDVVHSLLSKGVNGTTSVRYDVSPKKTDHTVPMRIAIENNDVHMVALLLSHNIPVRLIQGFTRFPTQDSVKLDLAIDPRVPDYDFETAYERDMYDRVMWFIAAGVEVKDRHLYRMFYKEEYRYVRLFHTILMKTRYFHLTQFDLPTLQETSLYAMRIGELRDELSMIRDALKDVKTNETWMNIQDNPILYPLIREAIDSYERCMDPFIVKSPNKWVDFPKSPF